MTESEFIHKSQAIFKQIQAKLDAHELDIESTILDAVLELETENGDTIILNRHQPSQEIWLAHAAGAAHFALQDGMWRNTRDGEQLSAALNALLGVTVFSEHDF